jgi:hypothetical protein
MTNLEKVQEKVKSTEIQIKHRKMLRSIPTSKSNKKRLKREIKELQKQLEVQTICLEFLKKVSYN